MIDIFIGTKKTQNPNVLEFYWQTSCTQVQWFFNFKNGHQILDMIRFLYEHSSSIPPFYVRKLLLNTTNGIAEEFIYQR